jgi:adenine-specific DNA-methyltransferase
MAARYPSYLLEDSVEGAQKEGELTGKPPKEGPFALSVRQGFVYERVPHIQLGDIARNAEIDIVWEKWQSILGPLLDRLNEELDGGWDEWQVPRKAGENWPEDARDLHSRWWAARCMRRQEIDSSISRNAKIEYLVDRPYEDRTKVRVAGPFTVEGLSPHRVLSAEEEDALWAEEIADEEGAGRCGRALAPGAARRRAGPRTILSASCSTICSRPGCRTPRRKRSCNSPS